MKTGKEKSPIYGLGADTMEIVKDMYERLPLAEKKKLHADWYGDSLTDIYDIIAYSEGIKQ